LDPLLTLNKHDRPVGIGPKAASIDWLLKHGFRVPVTHVCTLDDHARYLTHREDYLSSLYATLSERLDPTAAYAVRSSADVEDGPTHSFAGQLSSVLDVRGFEDLVRAVDHVFQSAGSPTMISYAEEAGLSAADIRVAAIIQEMVRPVFSGVVFTKNPITGLDETIVEAVEGDGTSLMQDGVTPERWVDKWGRWKERPETPRVHPEVISAIVTDARRIAKAHGGPIDLEWAFDGDAVFWLQVRPITALEHLSVYSDRISREVLPGMIKPLVWSVNVPLVNGAWIRLFTELIGPNDIRPEDLSKAFHYRAYFNMGTIGKIMVALGLPRETLEVVMGLEGGSETPSFKPTLGTARHAPRMVRFAVHKLRYGRRVEDLIPASRRSYEDLVAQPLREDDEAAVLDRIDRLFALTQEIAYANIVGPILMRIYASMLDRRLTRNDVQPSRFDVTAGMDELHDYSPDYHLDRLGGQFAELDEATRSQIEAADYEAFTRVSGIEDLQQGMTAFIERFGHLSDSGNDFSKEPWRETPDLVLRMVVDRGNRLDDRPQTIPWAALPLSRTERVRSAWLYGRARRFRLHRETVSFHYTYGYGLFRHYFMLLGESFADRGLIEAPSDIFYLYQDEVRRAVQSGAAAESHTETVAERRQEMDAARDAVLPEIIYGEQAPPLERLEEHARRLSGIATSPGYYRGPVRVIRSVTEFERLRPGDVLVIPYSDVSWTPLFAKAGAVVAESGGILSHSSIVARERRLPAVVSVGGACSALTDGVMVSVDGYDGEVVVDE
jgi:phosphohistidine swiveling domain-containing protein